MRQRIDRGAYKGPAVSKPMQPGQTVNPRPSGKSEPLALFCKVCERKQPAAICPDHLELLERTAAELLHRLPLIARTYHGQQLLKVLHAGGVRVSTK